MVCLLLIAVTAAGQITRPMYNNAILITHTPGDLGFGMRYDRYFHSTCGAYVSSAYGTYRLESGSVRHSHASIGCVIFMPDSKPGIISYSISCGAIFHKYVINTDYREQIDTNVLNPLSFEFGGGVNINRFSGNIRIDPVKMDVSLDFGYNF